jgi:predicted phosphoribosyltransferase
MDDAYRKAMNGYGPYRDRRAAGRQLAELLSRRAWEPSALVVGLPRGGVPVAAEIAARLNLALDVLVVRKLGLPEQPEVAIGAIASGGVTILNDWMLAGMPNPSEVIQQVLQMEQAELRRREEKYRPGRPPLEVAGRTVIVVDDGLATGATMAAAVESLRQRGAGRCVVAVPVASEDAFAALESRADEVICPLVPEGFSSVGEFYDDFSQTGDEEVRELLAREDIVR